MTFDAARFRRNLDRLAGEIILTPSHPAFRAAFDCQWDVARAIAAELGPEHLAAVNRAAHLAELEAAAEAADNGDAYVCPRCETDCAGECTSTVNPRERGRW